jgi:metal-responsive CopG/Arc/MetJ family transcriptional regulator
VSIQIAVRLPDELVGYLDELVVEGASSRAAVVADAVRAHRRRRLAERDADILAATGDYEDLAGIAAYASVALD